MSAINEWRPGVVEKRSCPWSYCHAIVDVYRHAPASDRLNETVDTVEQHAIKGPNSWYRIVCPGSHLLIPLSAKGREVLAEHNERFQRALRDRLRSQQTPAELSAENARIEAEKRAGTLGHLDNDPRLYYPPRPSDVEEVEGLPVPSWVGLHHHRGRGGQNVVSSNDTTVSLANQAKQSIGSAQEDMAGGTHIVELLDAKLKSVSEHLAVAGQLIAAAAQASPAPPRLADSAAGFVAMSSNHIDDASGRAAGVVTKIHEAFAAADQAIQDLNAFVAQITA